MAKKKASSQAERIVTDTKRKAPPSKSNSKKKPPKKAANSKKSPKGKSAASWVKSPPTAIMLGQG